MRLLTILAVAALVAGVYHYRVHRKLTLPRPKRRAREDEPIVDLGPMQSGIATGR